MKVIRYQTSNHWVVGTKFRFIAAALALVFAADGCGGSQQSPAVRQNLPLPGSPGELFLRPVECTIPPQSSDAVPGPAESGCHNSTPALIAITPMAQETAGSWVIVPYIKGGVRYVLGPADLTSIDFASANAEPAPGAGFEVVLKLTPAGSRKFNAIVAVRYPYYRQNPSNPPPQSEEAIEQGDAVLAAPPLEGSTNHGFVVIRTPEMNLGFARELAGIINEIITYHKHRLGVR